MTVNTTEITDGPYTGNGVTDEFAYNFRIDANTQLDVYLTPVGGSPTLQTLTTHYTVSGVGDDAGGLVTMVTPPATDEILYIRSSYPQTQLTNFSSQGAFLSKTHEDAFDKLTFLLQQLNDITQRSLRFSENYSGGASAELPEPVANMFFRWNADADAIILSSSSGDLTAPGPIGGTTADTGEFTKLGAGNALGALSYRLQIQDSGNDPLIGYIEKKGSTAFSATYGAMIDLVSATASNDSVGLQYQASGVHAFAGIKKGTNNYVIATNISATPVDSIIVDPSGNVGIGGAPVSGRNLTVGDASTSAVINIFSSNSDSSILEFGDSDDANVGHIEYDHSDDTMNLRTAADDRVTVNSTGLGIGTPPSYPLDVLVPTGDAQMQLRADEDNASSDAVFRFSTRSTVANCIIMCGDQDDANAGQLHYNHGDNRWTFTANATQVVSIDDSGLTFDAGSNYLGDYEEGSFTPDVGDGSNNMTLATALGSYTRIGNRCLLNIRVTGSSLGSVTGSIRIKGLPFTAKNTSDLNHAFAIGSVAGFAITDGHSVNAQLGANGTEIFLHIADVTTGNSNCTAAEFSDDGDICITGQYEVE